MGPAGAQHWGTHSLLSREPYGGACGECQQIASSLEKQQSLSKGHDFELLFAVAVSIML